MKNSNLEILPFLLSPLLATLRQVILGRDSIDKIKRLQIEAFLFY
jgi:hypothetical protein